MLTPSSPWPAATSAALSQHAEGTPPPQSFKPPWAQECPRIRHAARAEGRGGEERLRLEERVKLT